MKKITVLILVTCVLSACSISGGAGPAGASVTPGRLCPNLDEQKAYHDLVFDDYQQRYPQYERFATVRTDDYSLSLPEGWSIDDGRLFSNILNAQGEKAGVIYTRSIDPDSALLGNHAELVNSWEIRDGNLSALSLVYCADEPAASGITRITIRQAILFEDKAKQKDVFLTFDKGYADGNTVTYLMPGDAIMRMAKTFVILKS